MKNIIKILISVVIIFLLFWLSIFLTRINTNIITIKTNINNPSIFINGKKTSSISYTYSDKILISIYKDGYYEYRKIHEIKDKKISLDITLVKKPEEKITDLVFSEKYDLLIKKYPIIKYLPYKNILFDIKYSENSTFDNFEIEIDTYEGYFETAIKTIESWGLNPADYNIKFNNYKNPFKI